MPIRLLFCVGTLLQLEPEQVRLGTADNTRGIAVLCIKGRAALVQRVNEMLASVLVEAVLLKAVYLSV